MERGYTYFLSKGIPSLKEDGSCFWCIVFGCWSACWLGVVGCSGVFQVGIQLRENGGSSKKRRVGLKRVTGIEPVRQVISSCSSTAAQRRHVVLGTWLQDLCDLHRVTPDWKK